MKTILFLLFCMLYENPLFTQFNIGFSKNIDFYKPYTYDTQEYLKINDKLSSATFNFHFTSKIIENKKLIWRAGLNYKHINYIVKEKIRAYYQPDYNNGTNILTQEILDLKNKSQSLGLLNEISLIILKNKKMKNEIGFSNEIFFLERYYSNYYYSNTYIQFDNPDVELYGFKSGLFAFFISSTNFSIFHRLTWQQSDKFSLATKISLGTNLYSDWDQFKKYAWLGVGLELGFGKKPLLKKKDK